MKLASYDDGSRDGHLVVVSRDLSMAHYASGIATRLQAVLDDWGFLAPQLEELSISLNHGRARHAFPFEPKRCRAPLARCAHWMVAQAWRGASEPPPPSGAGPRLQRGAGDALLGPAARVRVPEGASLDGHAQWVMLTGEVPAHAAPASALAQVRLLGLAAAWWVRPLPEGADPLHAWPASSFSPVLATPDELGDAWQAGQLWRPVAIQRDGSPPSLSPPEPAMHWHAGQLIAWAARGHPLGAGTLIGTGARPGLCDALHGLHAGERIHIDMSGADGHSLFGAITPELIDANSDDAEEDTP